MAFTITVNDDKEAKLNRIFFSLPDGINRKLIFSDRVDFNKSLGTLRFYSYNKSITVNRLDILNFTDVFDLIFPILNDDMIIFFLFLLHSFDDINKIITIYN